MCDFWGIYVHRLPAAQRYSLWMSPVSSSCQPAAASVSTATIKGYRRSMFSSVTCIYEPNSQGAKFISSLLKPEWWLLGSTDVATSFCSINSPSFSQPLPKRWKSESSFHTYIYNYMFIYLVPRLLPCICSSRDWWRTDFSKHSFSWNPKVEGVMLPRRISGEKMRFCLLVNSPLNSVNSFATFPLTTLTLPGFITRHVTI